MRIFESENEKAVSGEMEKVLNGQGSVLTTLLENYESLDLADKGISYAVINKIEKIVKAAKERMNGIVRQEMGGQREFETASVKIIFDNPGPEDVVDNDKLIEVCGGRGVLLEKGIMRAETTYTLDEKVLERAILDGQIEPEKVKAAMVQQTRAPRLIVNPKGDLKKRLTAMAKKYLPSGE